MQYRQTDSIDRQNSKDVQYGTGKQHRQTMQYRQTDSVQTKQTVQADKQHTDTTVHARIDRQYSTGRQAFTDNRVQMVSKQTDSTGRQTIQHWQTSQHRQYWETVHRLQSDSIDRQ